MTQEPVILHLDKDGNRVNSGGQLIDRDNKPLDGGTEQSEVHSKYMISKYVGEPALEMSFHVQHVLQSHLVKSRGDVLDMLSDEDKKTVESEGELPEDIARKYSGKMLSIQGDVIAKLEPKAMFGLVKALFEGVLVNNKPALQELGGHFVENKSHVMPVLREVIEVNDFLDLDMTALL